MKPKIILLLFLLIFSNYHQSLSQSCINRTKDLKRDGDVQNNLELSKIFNNDQLRLEGSYLNGDYVIGPEIAVTGATGFYDYQTNGDCKHHIYRFAPDNLSAIFTISTDSLNISNSRRTVYCYSTNEGISWVFGEQIPPGIRSGFPSMTVTPSGQAVISSHLLVSGITRGVLFVDVAPLAVTFAQYTTPYNIAWPGCSMLSNGSIMVSGSTYHNSAATDTGIVSIFNGASFSNTNRFIARNDVDHSYMRWIYAAGPNGKALYLLDPLSDIGGNNGYNRMFISTTSNFGVNWSSPMAVFFDPQVLMGEFAKPYYGMDAIYDASGNYYIAFNTTDEAGNYGSARLWVSKNGGIPVLVAQHVGINGIPEAASNMANPQSGICSIDHPSLSISSDGLIIYVAYSVAFENDILNDFNKCHIYISTSLTSSLQFSSPVKITNSGTGSFDERYCSISPVTPNLSGGLGRSVYLVYQKDPQPGSGSFNDLAPISRASLIFRRITDLSYPVTNINNSNSGIPKEFILLQNYPNPFNPATTINYSIPIGSEVELEVFDILGNKVEVLFKGIQKAGNYKASFNATDMSSGIYIYRLTAGNFTESRKMLLVK